MVIQYIMRCTHCIIQRARVSYASQKGNIAKSDLCVLSCLDTRKNQRKSRPKSPTRWVPRGWNCHAIQFPTPAAWLMWYRLPGPAPRSTPDPLAGQAFMPLVTSSAPLSLQERGKGEVGFIRTPNNKQRKTLPTP